MTRKRSFATPFWAALTAAAVYVFHSFPAAAQTNPFVGTWQSPLARFTFMADGRAVGQQISGGVVYSSFGSYAVTGDVLSVRFDSVEPAKQCGTSIGADHLVHTSCMPAAPIRPMGFRVRFQGPNTFVWGFDQPGPTTFVRVQ